MRATPEPSVTPTSLRASGIANVTFRGRVVVVVGGVMSIQGDGSAVHKAKDHSRALSSSGISCNCVVGFSKWRYLRAMESWMR